MWLCHRPDSPLHQHRVRPLGAQPPAAHSKRPRATVSNRRSEPAHLYRHHTLAEIEGQNRLLKLRPVDAKCNGVTLTAVKIGFAGVKACRVYEGGSQTS